MPYAKRYRRFQRKPLVSRARRYSLARTPSRPKPITYSSLVRTQAVTPTGISNANQHFGSAWFLTGLPDYADFTNLYTQYRIRKIDVKILFTRTDAAIPSATTAGSVVPVLYMVNEYSDRANMTAKNEYMCYDSLRIWKMTDGIFKTTVYPKAAIALFTTAYNGSGNVSSPWIDVSSPNVEHRGIKFMVESDQNGGGGLILLGQMQVFYTYHLQFRGLR